MAKNPDAQFEVHSDIEVLDLPQTIRGTRQLILDVGADVLHVNQPHLPTIAAGRVAKKHPMVVTMHTPALKTSLSVRGRALRLVAFPAVDKWIVLSQSNRELLASRVSPRKISVVQPGLPQDRFRVFDDADVRSRIGIPPSSWVIGTVGRLSQQKRHDVLIEAFRLASQAIQDSTLVIVGEGELESETRALADRLAPGRVIFTGQLTDVPRVLRCFDTFVLSSDFEGLPFALLEAMATERAIVSTGVQGAREAIRDEQDGLVVPRRNPERLAEAIVRIAHDRTLAAALAASARRRFLEQFTADRMVDRTVSLYGQFLSLPTDSR